MLLLPLLSRIFAVLQAPITGTDEANTHRRLQEAYLTFFTALMNANLDGVFITARNKPEFENVLSALLNQATDASDSATQRQALAFFSKTVIAWGSLNSPTVFTESALSEKSKMVANGTSTATNQHAITKEERAKQALPGYESFIYQRLLPLCFEIPADAKFQVRFGQPVSPGSRATLTSPGFGRTRSAPPQHRASPWSGDTRLYAGQSLAQDPMPARGRSTAHEQPPNSAIPRLPQDVCGIYQNA